MAGPERSWVRRLELGALVAFGLQFVVSFWYAGRVFFAFESPIEALGLALGGLVGAWVFADALSGLIHYLGDRVGHAHWPILGPAFIQPFREHHERPRAIVSHGLAERTGTHALGALPLCAGAMALGQTLLTKGPDALGALTLFTLVGLSFWIVLTGEIHAWAHSRTNPKWVRRGQQLGLILSPKQHAKHHRGDHSSHYCITSGVLDRTLGWVRSLPRPLTSRIP